MEAFKHLGWLGHGSYGDVQLCEVGAQAALSLQLGGEERQQATRKEHLSNESSTQFVALKTWRNAHHDNKIMRIALREVTVLNGLNHCNVVKLLRAFRTPSGRVCMVFDYGGSSAQQILEDRFPFGMPQPQLKRIAFQLLQALKYLHAVKVIHRDVKPANVLVDADGVLRLCDFGFARYYAGEGAPAAAYHTDPRDSGGAASANDRLTPYVVTRWYRAPEVLLGMQYGAAADIWSLGCTLAELATGEPLLPGTSSLDQLARIVQVTGPLNTRMAAGLSRELRHALNALIAGHVAQKSPNGLLRQRLAGRLSAPLMDLLEACLRPDPRDRPTAEQLLRLPFFLDAPRLFAGSPLDAHYIKDPLYAAMSIQAVAGSSTVAAAAVKSAVGATAPAVMAAAAAVPHHRRYDNASSQQERHGERQQRQMVPRATRHNNDTSSSSMSSVSMGSSSAAGSSASASANGGGSSTATNTMRGSHSTASSLAPSCSLGGGSSVSRSSVLGGAGSGGVGAAGFSLRHGSSMCAAVAEEMEEELAAANAAAAAAANAAANADSAAVDTSVAADAAIAKAAAAAERETSWHGDAVKSSTAEPAVAAQPPFTDNPAPAAAAAISPPAPQWGTAGPVLVADSSVFNREAAILALAAAISFSNCAAAVGPIAACAGAATVVALAVTDPAAAAAAAATGVLTEGEVRRPASSGYACAAPATPPPPQPEPPPEPLASSTSAPLPMLLPVVHPAPCVTRNNTNIITHHQAGMEHCCAPNARAASPCVSFGPGAASATETAVWIHSWIERQDSDSSNVMSALPREAALAGAGGTAALFSDSSVAAQAQALACVPLPDGDTPADLPCFSSPLALDGAAVPPAHPPPTAAAAAAVAAARVAAAAAAAGLRPGGATCDDSVVAQWLESHRAVAPHTRSAAAAAVVSAPAAGGAAACVTTTMSLGWGNTGSSPQPFSNGSCGTAAGSRASAGAAAQAVPGGGVGVGGAAAAPVRVGDDGPWPNAVSLRTAAAAYTSARGDGGRGSVPTGMCACCAGIAQQPPDPLHQQQRLKSQVGGGAGGGGMGSVGSVPFAGRLGERHSSPMAAGTAADGSMPWSPGADSFEEYDSHCHHLRLLGIAGRSRGDGGGSSCCYGGCIALGYSAGSGGGGGGSVGLQEPVAVAAMAVASAAAGSGSVPQQQRHRLAVAVRRASIGPMGLSPHGVSVLGPVTEETSTIRSSGIIAGLMSGATDAADVASGVLDRDGLQSQPQRQVQSQVQSPCPSSGVTALSAYTIVAASSGVRLESESVQTTTTSAAATPQRSSAPAGVRGICALHANANYPVPGAGAAAGAFSRADAAAAATTGTAGGIRDRDTTGAGTAGARRSVVTNDEGSGGSHNHKVFTNLLRRSRLWVDKLFHGL